jgi:hypothetical protein
MGVAVCGLKPCRHLPPDAAVQPQLAPVTTKLCRMAIAFTEGAFCQKSDPTTLKSSRISAFRLATADRRIVKSAGMRSRGSNVKRQWLLLSHDPTAHTWPAGASGALWRLCDDDVCVSGQHVAKFARCRLGEAGKLDHNTHPATAGAGRRWERRCMRAASRRRAPIWRLRSPRSVRPGLIPGHPRATRISPNSQL